MEKLEILSLLLLRYPKQLNNQIEKAYWVQDETGASIELHFKDNTSEINTLLITDHDFLSDSADDIIIDSRGNPIAVDFFNPFDNINLNVNKFIYKLDDYSKVMLVNDLFSPSFESRVIKRFNNKDEEGEAKFEMYQFFADKLIEAVLRFCNARNITLSSDEHTLLLSFLYQLKRSTKKENSEHSFTLSFFSDLNASSSRILTIHFDKTVLDLAETDCTTDLTVGSDCHSNMLLGVLFNEDGIKTIAPFDYYDFSSALESVDRINEWAGFISIEKNL